MKRLTLLITIIGLTTNVNAASPDALSTTINTQAVADWQLAHPRNGTTNCAVALRQPTPSLKSIGCVDSALRLLFRSLLGSEWTM